MLMNYARGALLCAAAIAIAIAILWFVDGNDQANAPRGHRAAISQVHFAEPPAAQEAPEQVDKQQAETAEVPEIDRLDAQGFSKLHRAAMGGRLSDAKKLLAQGASPAVQQKKFQGTPLQYAASAGHAEVVQLLIKAGAKVDARDSQGRTPLTWAADKGNVDATRKLVEAKADVRAVNNGGWTPLHYAMSRRHQEVAQLLVDNGAKLDALNVQRKTPLELAPDMELKLPAEAPEKR